MYSEREREGEREIKASCMDPSMYRATFGDVGFLKKIKASCMDPSMYRAATSGDVDFLKKMRDGDLSTDLLSQKTPTGNNVLHLAAEFKQINFFKEVPLDKRSQLFWAVNKMGDTPMHIAARVGCDEVVDFLIERAKALHVRKTGDQERGPTYAESYKSKLRKTNLEKHTALHVAAQYGHREVVNSLMKADPKLCSSAYSAKESPLFLAICKGFSNIARDILNESSISPSVRGINGVTALHAAVTHTYQGAEEIVKIMAPKYPDIIKKADALGWTPLHYAAFRGNLEAIKLLMNSDKSCTVYMLDKCGMSALHIAAYKGHIEVMKQLIQCRPDTCECLNANDQNILHVAVLGTQSHVVEYIVKTPEIARLMDQADTEGNTPLHLALTCQNEEIIRILSLDGGVDNTATHKEFSLVVDNFLGDNIEVQEIVDSSYQGRKFGVPFFQEQIRRDFKKLELHPGKEKPAESAIAGDGNKRISDVNMLVATLIATVTFAAALAPPGGYGDNGKMILQEDTYFKYFETFNMISFVFSVMVLFLECCSTYWGSKFPYFPRLKPRGFLIVSLIGMFVAFVLGPAAGQTRARNRSPGNTGTTPLQLSFLLLACVPQIIEMVIMLRNAARQKFTSGSAETV